MKEKSLSNVIEEQISGEWGDDGDGVSVLRSTNFTNEGRLNFENVVQRSIDKKKIEKKRLVFGDSIIEKSGGSPDQPVGRVVYFDIQEGTFLCNNFTSILRPSKEVHSKYFFWFLFYNHQTKQTLKYQNKTTGIINLQLTRYLQDTKIPIPPIAIQEKIATILTKADTLHQKDKQLLRLYDDLAQSMFYEMFSDGYSKYRAETLDKVCIKITDGTHKTPSYRSDGTLFISAKNVKENRLVWEDIKHISNEEHEQLTKRCKAEYQDILITKSGSIGMAAIVDVNFEFSLFESLALLKYKRDLINGAFLHFFLNSNEVQNQIKKKHKGVGVKHLHLADIRNLRIFIPPIQTQNEFEYRIKSIEAHRNLMLRSKETSENLFQSLLQRAFKGELVS